MIAELTLAGIGGFFFGSIATIGILTKIAVKLGK